MAWLAKKFAQQQKEPADKYWQCSDKSCDWVNLAWHNWCSQCKKSKESPHSQKPAPKDNQLAQEVKALCAELKAHTSGNTTGTDPT